MKKKWVELEKKNEPRICDIDIIDLIMDYNENSEKITLPHPKSSERNFVLLPLRKYVLIGNILITNKKIRYFNKKFNFKSKE